MAAIEGMTVPGWKRAVIKVGSALIAPEGHGCSTTHVLPIARFIIESRRRGKEIVLVSSGAVAAGHGATAGQKFRATRSIPEKQALAAIGQSLLMASWSRFFDFPCAQLLLTYDDLADRRRFANARNTLKELLRHEALPIVNENDTVAVEELKVGDNDNLAAHVAVLAGADILIICSDVDGLFDADPRRVPEARHIPSVDKIDDHIYGLAGEAASPSATGGMRTKIEAADKATARGIDTVLVNGTNSSCLDHLLNDTLYGTFFHRRASPLDTRKYWLRHTIVSAGEIEVDAGAAHAVCTKGASLLPSGIIAVEGPFVSGDAVLLTIRNNGRKKTIAKGITQYSDQELRMISGRQSKDIEKILGYVCADVAIHRDDLVLLDA